MTSKARHRKRDVTDANEEQQVTEPEVEIQLTCDSVQSANEVRFAFKEGQYQQVLHQDLTIDLLTLPSRVIHRETRELQEQPKQRESEEEADEEVAQNTEKNEESKNIFEELQAVYGGMMTAEQLAKLDSQPNPFNFSERVSQTARVISKAAFTQTDPPPGNTFADTASLSAIYDAYEKDYVLVLAKQRELEKQKEMEEEKEREKSGKTPEKEKSSQFQRGGKNEIGKVPKGPPDPIVLPPTPPPSRPCLAGEELGLDPITVKMTERLVNQNIFDEITQGKKLQHTWMFLVSPPDLIFALPITQILFLTVGLLSEPDFRYWDDASDEYRQLEGSLLPLWKFSCDKSRSFVVSSLSWSPAHHDLFAASYTAVSESESEGRICLFTLKNPGIPERMLVTPRGVVSLQFHPSVSRSTTPDPMPSHESLVVAGHSDGTVTVYDARSAASPSQLSSSTTSGKHLLPVMQINATRPQVRWIMTEPGEKMSFYSVSQDGRVSQWFVRTTSLKHEDVLNFHAAQQTKEHGASPSKINLEGTATCIALSPERKDVLLFGVDTGSLFQVCTSDTAHAITRYRAHHSPVTAVTWNNVHTKVFASCALDWTVKIWLQYHLSALMTLDLGGPVMGLAWSPSSSTLVVAITDDGRMFVYDLFLRKYHPLCVQNLLQRRRSSLTCVAFNPSQPIVLVGGGKGYLVAFKLSPNLRKPHKDAKCADEEGEKAIELCKMERIIATCRA
ncbi:dynein intermediate chain 2, ciliary-like [Penaeus japonicus]|uniref:dynein intermediate chain 2, ciliary-like n=1 Tax=Penaeus japonicus TaxID=27405 RepID=UPI001C7157AC|nr:dynein intermediate chain 2, ciliary-like [Penaeus japonicus]